MLRQPSSRILDTVIDIDVNEEEEDSNDSDSDDVQSVHKKTISTNNQKMELSLLESSDEEENKDKPLLNRDKKKSTSSLNHNVKETKKQNHFNYFAFEGVVPHDKQDEKHLSQKNVNSGSNNNRALVIKDNHMGNTIDDSIDEDDNIPKFDMNRFGKWDKDELCSWLDAILDGHVLDSDEEEDSSNTQKKGKGKMYSFKETVLESFSNSGVDGEVFLTLTGDEMKHKLGIKWKSVLDILLREQKKLPFPDTVQPSIISLEKEDDLEKVFGISSFAHKRKLWNNILNLKDVLESLYGGEVMLSTENEKNTETSAIENEKTVSKESKQKEEKKVTDRTPTEFSEEKSIINLLSDEEEADKDYKREEKCTYKHRIEGSFSEATKDTFYCSICMDNIVIDDIHRLGCKHKFCRNCMSTYLLHEKKLKNFPIICPECRQEAPISDFALLVDEKTLKELEEEYSHSLFERSPEEYVHCMTPDCGAIFMRTEGVSQLHCPKCKKLYCLSCEVEYHTGYTCESYQKWLSENKNADSMFEKLSKKKNWKRCPSCNRYVEKRNGCDHIKCVCKKEFCYKCGFLYKECKCRTNSGTMIREIIDSFSSNNPYQFFTPESQRRHSLVNRSRLLNRASLVGGSNINISTPPSSNTVTIPPSFSNSSSFKNTNNQRNTSNSSSILRSAESPFLSTLSSRNMNSQRNTNSSSNTACGSVGESRFSFSPFSPSTPTVTTQTPQLSYPRGSNQSRITKSKSELISSIQKDLKKYLDEHPQIVNSASESHKNRSGQCHKNNRHTPYRNYKVYSKMKKAITSNSNGFSPSEVNTLLVVASHLKGVNITDERKMEYFKHITSKILQKKGSKNLNTLNDMFDVI